MKLRGFCKAWACVGRYVPIQAAENPFSLLPESVPETLRSGGEAVSGIRSRIERQVPSMPPSAPPSAQPPSIEAWDLVSESDDADSVTLVSGVGAVRRMKMKSGESPLEQLTPSEMREVVLAVQHAAVTIDVSLRAIANQSHANDWHKMAIENAKYIGKLVSSNVKNDALQNVRHIADRIVVAMREMDAGARYLQRQSGQMMTVMQQRRVKQEREKFRQASVELIAARRDLVAWLDEEEAQEMRQKIEEQPHKNISSPSEDSAELEIIGSDWVDDASQYPTNPVL